MTLPSVVWLHVVLLSLKLRVSVCVGLNVLLLGQSAVKNFVIKFSEFTTLVATYNYGP